MHNEISFADFEKNYIRSPDGYLPVWFSFEEPQPEEEMPPGSRVLKMDMVVPFRLGDGKISFISVQIENKDQADKAIKYLRETQRLLHESLELNFTDAARSLTSLS